jgi:hypothetical protein
MNVLNILSLQSEDPNSYVSAERQISGYLQSPGASLEKLSEAIDRKAETSRVYIRFWTTMGLLPTSGATVKPINEMSTLVFRS